MTTPKTDVVFRVWPKSDGGDVIAIFPGEIADNSPYYCLSYQHIGQHGACDPTGLTHLLRLATPAEYKDLATELRRRSYRLRIIKRIRQAHLAARLYEFKRINNLTAPKAQSKTP